MKDIFDFLLVVDAAALLLTSVIFLLFINSLGFFGAFNWNDAKRRVPKHEVKLFKLRIKILIIIAAILAVVRIFI